MFSVIKQSTPFLTLEFVQFQNWIPHGHSLPEPRPAHARHGLQMVMFTHQDPAVWADLGMILWAAGLKATAAWTISTETEAVGIKVEYEFFAVRAKNEKSDFQTVIERALGIACDTLVPRGLDQSSRELSLVERYVLRALDIESRGERRKGMYEELARGFGVTDIKPLLKSDKANGARMFTPTGLAASLLAPRTASPRYRYGT